MGAVRYTRMLIYPETKERDYNFLVIQANERRARRKVCRSSCKETARAPI